MLALMGLLPWYASWHLSLVLTVGNTSFLLHDQLTILSDKIPKTNNHHSHLWIGVSENTQDGRRDKTGSIC